MFEAGGEFWNYVHKFQEVERRAFKAFMEDVQEEEILLYLSYRKDMEAIEDVLALRLKLVRDLLAQSKEPAAEAFGHLEKKT